MKRRTFLGISSVSLMFPNAVIAKLRQGAPIGDMFEPGLIESESCTSSHEAIIKVIGVGGVGGLAVDQMIKKRVDGVKFLVADSDEEALSRSATATSLLLKKAVFCTGAKLSAYREEALELRALIAQSLYGADMVFITAGMGGFTGSIAAPIIAEITRELGIFTVAVVTKPFGFKDNCLMVAEAGIAELQKHVDSLIVVSDDKQQNIHGNENSTLSTFGAADMVLPNSICDIAQVINAPSLVGVDFDDVITVLGDTGMYIMGSANAVGLGRARTAAERAVTSLFLKGNRSNSRSALVVIASANELKLSEVGNVMDTVMELVADDIFIIFGTVCDETMSEGIRVNVFASSKLNA